MYLSSNRHQKLKLPSMTVFAKAKRVTVSLGDEAKARIFSSSGSGSDHSGDISDGNSPRLSELVLDFLEDGSETLQIDSESDSERYDSVAEPSTTAFSDEIVKIRDSDSDRYRILLLAHVMRATESYSGLGSEQRSIFRRKITAFLQELGHDAAVCKSRWTSAASIPAGSHEFIDVVYKPTPGAPAIRYLVDTEFASNFEIARPTRQYARVVQSLPGVFVGKEQSLRRMVRVACEAAKQSLKSRGLSMPPWRRKSYLEKKWCGPYKRTTGSTLTPLIPSVSCRSFGFDEAVNGRLSIKI